MQFWASVMGLGVAAGCAGPFGRAPLVLTEVPNGSSGRALVTLGATRSGCAVEVRSEDLRLLCPEGEVDIPTFTGPPTFAARCVDPRLQEVAACRALVRKVLLASEAGAPSS
jgi:hypothetical protein